MNLLLFIWFDLNSAIDPLAPSNIKKVRPNTKTFYEDFTYFEEVIALREGLFGVNKMTLSLTKQNDINIL